jgi:hypothetical protein
LIDDACKYIGNAKRYKDGKEWRAKVEFFLSPKIHNPQEYENVQQHWNCTDYGVNYIDSWQRHFSVQCQFTFVFKWKIEKLWLY